MPPTALMHRVLLPAVAVAMTLWGPPRGAGPESGDPQVAAPPVVGLASAAITGVPPMDALVERSLSELSAAAADYVASRKGRVGVAVVVPERGTVFTVNGEDLFPLASVVKVLIMATVLDSAMREGRSLSAGELALLEPMITLSDNDAADALWQEMGGGTAMTGYLEAISLTDVQPDPGLYWGASEATARAVALLLAKLAAGEILDEPSRAQALDWLDHVHPAQSWGVAAGVADEPPGATLIGIKNGWYPASGGWWVNSAGIVLPGDDRPAYTLAVLTTEQPSLWWGIETIEDLARLVHAALREPQRDP